MCKEKLEKIVAQPDWVPQVILFASSGSGYASGKNQTTFECWLSLALRLIVKVFFIFSRETHNENFWCI
jgi:hypothetical protein